MSQTLKFLYHDYSDCLTMNRQINGIVPYYDDNENKCNISANFTISRFHYKMIKSCLQHYCTLQCFYYSIGVLYYYGAICSYVCNKLAIENCMIFKSQSLRMPLYNSDSVLCYDNSYCHQQHQFYK